MRIWLFWILHINGIIKYVAFLPWFFYLAYIFEIYLHYTQCSACNNTFINFYGWIIFLHMDKRLFYLLCFVIKIFSCTYLASINALWQNIHDFWEFYIFLLCLRIFILHTYVTYTYHNKTKPNPYVLHRHYSPVNLGSQVMC